MNSIWNNNISQFQSRFPQLAELYSELIEKINQLQPEAAAAAFSFWNISTAKNGSPTVAVQFSNGNKMQLHSSYNPEREAASAATKIKDSDNSTVVFFGFGLGYQVIELSRICNSKKIILIEPDPVHFFGALYFIDWSDVFKIPQLIIAAGCPAESIISLIENNGENKQLTISTSSISDAYFFTMPSFTVHNQPYFDSIKTLIERNKTKNEINQATFNKFARRWIKNSLKNLPLIKKCRTVARITEEYRQISDRKTDFVVVAAGPSLQETIPLLQLLQGRTVIVCVETALKALLRNNIHPDFIIVTDPQYWAYRHIAGLEAPESILVAPLSVYPAVFRFKCREIILCSDIFPVSQFFEKKLGSFGDLGAGGSVASSAWNLAFEMGAENIYLAGLDLSYPDKETHIKGSSAEQTFHTKSLRIQSAEKFSCGSMYSAYPEYGINYKNEKVLTDSRMKMFAWWFESRIAASPSVKNWTLSPESMKIPGVEYSEQKIADLKTLYSVPSVQKPDTNCFDSNCSVPSVQYQHTSNIESEFFQSIANLKNLINTAVEKCLINAPTLPSDLEIINRQLNLNSMSSLLVMAEPSKSWLEANQTNPKELARYIRFQQILSLFTNK